MGFFIESNLEVANFCKSQLEVTDFENTNIKGARFDEADLRGAKNLTIEQLSKVSMLYEAKLDDKIFASLEEKI
ncbi:pentapeptide repeat-containing protein [Methanosarcina sp.]|uniref:pentapeptide repeat-containing protein n=1 Tax=Methanosarcina sp. TaxID=2213 RepID=UPI003C74E9B9